MSDLLKYFRVPCTLNVSLRQIVVAELDNIICSRETILVKCFVCKAAVRRADLSINKRPHSYFEIQSLFRDVFFF